MYTATISLSNIDTVKKFVTITNKYDFPVNLYSERYVVNGKSIMGIFSLNLSKPVKLEVTDECSQEFINDMKPFLRAE